MPPKPTTKATTAAKPKIGTTTTSKKPAGATKTGVTSAVKKNTTSTTSKSGTKTGTKKSISKQEIEQKQEKEESKEEIQKQEKQQEQQEQEEQKKEDVVGKATVTYNNNYKNQFPVKNGEMKWTDIDEEFCISFAFEGNFGKKLIKKKDNKALDSKDFPTDKVDDDGKLIAETIFYRVELNEEYDIKIVEDVEAEAKIEHKTFKAEQKEENKPRGEGCSCIYGNPCMDKYICNDWNNRYEVAKKNGWKGFS